MSMKYYIRNTRNSNTVQRAPVDIIETDESYIVKANLPGYTKDEIEIVADFESLRFTAKREIDEKEIKYIHRERYANELTRTMTFRKPVDASKSSVKFELGVLEIELPFAENAKTVKLLLEN